MKNLSIFFVLGLALLPYSLAHADTASCNLSEYSEGTWVPMAKTYQLQLNETGDVLLTPPTGESLQTVPKQRPVENSAQLARFEGSESRGNLNMIIFKPTSAERAQGVLRMEVFLANNTDQPAYGGFCVRGWENKQFNLSNFKVQWTCEAINYDKQVFFAHGTTLAQASNAVRSYPYCGTGGSCRDVFCRADKYVDNFFGYWPAKDRYGMKRCYRVNAAHNEMLGTDEDFVNDGFCQYTDRFWD